MGRMIALLAVLIAVLSCGLEEVGHQPGAGDGVWIGPGNVIGGSGSGTDKKEVWYAVGVDYPQGYDWRADVEKGSVRCSLVVFADGIPMMKVPVGDDYEVSSDPDMHRMVDGALFTDYSAAGETVIKRNGEEIIRYAGLEMIVAIAVEGDHVYTLGQNRSGSGFSFRRNGEVLLERNAGYAFPRIQRVEDGYGLAFYEPDEESERGRCFHYLAGDICEIAARKDVVKVWDIILHEDRICYIASMLGVSSPVLMIGDEKSVLEVKDDSVVNSCRFVEDGRGMYVEGIMYKKGNDLFSAIWKGAELHATFRPGYIVSSTWLSDDSLSCTLNASSAFSTGVIYRGGECHEIPLGYVTMGGRSMVMAEGKLYVGLTPETEGTAAVWVENEMKPLKINGFISHMSVY